jgi:hypothetical protein
MGKIGIISWWLEETEQLILLYTIYLLLTDISDVSLIKIPSWICAKILPIAP